MGKIDVYSHKQHVSHDAIDAYGIIVFNLYSNNIEDEISMVIKTYIDIFTATVLILISEKAQLLAFKSQHRNTTVHA